jgi:uncharacterized protein DUF1761
MTEIESPNIGISFAAIIISALAAFSFSLAWYSPLMFGDIWMKYRDASLAAAPLWKFFLAPLREIITASVLAFLIARVRPATFTSALALGLVLWAGFYAVQLTGAVIWDNRPWQLSAVHAGDWLMKTLFMTVVLAWWSGSLRTSTRGQ